MASAGQSCILTAIERAENSKRYMESELGEYQRQAEECRLAIAEHEKRIKELRSSLDLLSAEIGEW